MRINPNSSIRSGYNFEDLFVIKLFLDWLKTPKLYKTVRLQNIPDEIDNNKFYLDDIVAVDKNNFYHFYQLKHRQNPDTDFWTIDSLLERGKKQQSLLEKWIKSMRSVKFKNCTGYFITNGLPDPAISNCLLHNRINLDNAEKLENILYNKFLQLASDKSEIETFLNNFLFLFNQPGKEEFESNLRNSYYRELGVTKAGFDNLLLSVSKEGSEKYPQEFTLDGIKKLLEWYNPRPLKQNFEIPQDFELYDSKKHENLLDELGNSDGGIKVIIGKPGVGKSTYLSNLHDVLDKHKAIVSIRHHYHLNTKDGTYYERLGSNRAIEALKAEFKRLPDELLGDIANQNLRNTPLHEIITNIAKSQYSLGKAFVLIIDGLDHVIRERKNEKELLNFLDEVLYPQSGLWIILGTQELAVQYFKSVVYEYAPRNKWTEIKGLKKNSIKELVLKNSNNFHLPKHNHALDEFIDKLYIKTSGNALHLRYVLNQLKAQHTQISTNSLRRILPYKDEIANYYSSLWRQLSAVGKTFTLAITLFECKMTEKDIFEFGSYLVNNPSKITDGYNQIKHLLRSNISGVSIYHNSFLVFINSQVELEQQKKVLFNKSRKWLKNTKNMYLKWLLMPQVEYQLGNPKLLLDINRDWVIESYLQCRNEKQIISLLDLASEAAFKLNNFSKVNLFKIFSSSVDNREYNLYDAIPKIWALAFKLNAQTHLMYPDIDFLESYQIKDYCIALKEKGILKNIPPEIYERFNELAQEDNYDKSIESHWIELISQFPNDKSPTEVHKFISQFKEVHKSGDLFATYTKCLLQLGYSVDLDKLLKQKFSINEKTAIIKILINYNLEHTTSYGHQFIIDNTIDIYLQNFYVFLIDNKLPSFQIILPAYSDFPTELDYDNSKFEAVLKLYLDTFFSGIVLYVTNQQDIVDNWLKGRDDRWSISITESLFEISKLIANSIQKKQRIDYTKIITAFSTIRMLDYSDDYKIYDLRRFVIPQCITTILQHSIFINIKNNFDYKYTDSDILVLQNCKWFYSHTIINHLSDFYSPPIILKGLNELAHFSTKNIETDIKPFRDKANTLIDLALIAYKCNSINIAKNLLLRSAQNIISYGYNKDNYLLAILQGIDYCARAGSTKTADLVRKVAPYVHVIGNFTDGEDTSSFIHDLADLYGKYTPQLLYKLYLKAVNEQDYYDAENFFAEIVSTLPASDPVNCAVMGTSLDSSSYNTLVYRSKTDKQIAKVLTNLKNTFGEINYSSVSTSGSTYKYKKVRRPAYSKVRPSELDSYLKNIKPQKFEVLEYVRERYLEGWLNYWINRKGCPKAEIFRAIKGIIESHFEDISAGILNTFYPLALEFDRDFAFNCLVWSHANGSLWGAFWATNLERSREMWQIAINDFPDRMDEYFEKTIVNTGTNYGKGGGYFIPIPKSILFFSDSNRFSTAEEILDAAINNLVELTPNIVIPVPEYINDLTVVDEFDILLCRLTWVNPAVRERAAIGISNLLIIDNTGYFHQKILHWLRGEKLESIISGALVAIIKSLENLKSKSYSYLKMDELFSAVDSRSTTLFILLNVIYSKINVEFPFYDYDTREYIDITDAPELEKFKRNIGHQIQRAFVDLCEDLESETKFKVFNLWALFYQQKKDQINLMEGQHVDDYCNSKSQYMLVRTTIISDLLRSSLMKVLDYMYHHGYINEQKLFFQAFNFIPIDLSIWQIKLSKQPKWWPRFKSAQTNKIFLTDFTQPIENILKPINGWTVFHIDGAITTAENFYDTTLNGKIVILPFAYKITGANLPSDQEIYNIVSHFGLFYPIGPYMDTFNLFYGPVDFHQNSPFPTVIKDLNLFPLLAGVKSLAGNTWQYYRMASNCKLPVPYISERLSLKLSNGKFRFIDNANKVIFKMEDFLFGLKDRSAYQSDIPYGRYLLINNTFLQETLRNQGLKLGYICKVQYRTKKYTHSEETDEASFYRLLNFSKLIF